MQRFGRLFLIIAIFFVGVSNASAQKISTNSKAQKSYDEGIALLKSRDFAKALVNFQTAISKDSAFGAAYLQAAALYRILQRDEDAYQFYSKVLAKYPVTPELSADYLTFADLSMAHGNYSQAAKYFQQVIDSGTKSARHLAHAQKQLKNVAFAQSAIKNPVPFQPKSLGSSINKLGLQYSPVLTADQQSLLFTARKGSAPADDEDLYIVQKKNGEWGEPASVSDFINSELNEGTASLSGDGRTLVFTSCDRPDSQGSCDLYISYRVGKDWSKPRNMGPNVNSATWDSQPSLSADGRKLYFSSNRKGSLGQEDIWICTRLENGNWGSPVNMGPSINTSGREASPFLHASGNTLYYATDGKPGMGGLDLFKVERTLNGWDAPVNLGYPLNTHLDEGSLFITPDNLTGYYSSGAVQQGKIELLQFDVPASWKGKTTSSFAQGRVLDAQTKKPLQAQVQVYDLDSASVVSQQVSSDPASGEYTIVVNQGQRYALFVTAPGHVLESRHIAATSTAKPLALDFHLQPLGKGAKAVLSNLFFDTGKATLRQESRVELDKLFQFLKTNPSIRVEIAGFTDNVGQPAANLKLSDARAKAVVAYLVSKGAPATIFQAKGYGEAQPTVPNTSEENRQLNRRIELRVL